MASSTAQRANGDPGPRQQQQQRGRTVGFLANVMKRKESFVQLFLMGGILMLSLRSLSQKYRIHDLARDAEDLRAERDALASRCDALRAALLREADLDPSGLLADHLRSLFHQHPPPEVTNPSSF